MSARQPLTAEEIEYADQMLRDSEAAMAKGAQVMVTPGAMKRLRRLCDAAESAAAQDAEIAELRQRADALHAALVDARGSVESWAGYAAEYFRGKHDLAGELARLDAVIAASQADGGGKAGQQP